MQTTKLPKLNDNPQFENESPKETKLSQEEEPKKQNDHENENQLAENESLKKDISTNSKKCSKDSMIKNLKICIVI